MGVFAAIGRWFKAFGYLLIGKTDQATQARMKNPHAMRAAYDEVVQKDADRVRNYKEAVAGILRVQEGKKHTLTQVTQEITELERMRAGALAKAKARAAALGNDKAQLDHDEEYLRCKTAYSDFGSTLAEKQQRVEELERDIAENDASLRKHKIQLQQLLRNLDKVKQEREEAVAEVITAEEQRQAAEMVAGISEDGSAATLQNLRTIRDQAKANAKISSELAGLDAKAEAAEFKQWAAQHANDDEFDALIGVAKQADEKAAASGEAAKQEEARLPE